MKNWNVRSGAVGDQKHPDAGSGGTSPQGAQFARAGVAVAEKMK